MLTAVGFMWLFLTVFLSSCSFHVESKRPPATKSLGDRHEHMKIAIKEACDGVEVGDGGPFGAVVVRDGNVVATGHNMVLVWNDPTAHAEVVAIRNACKKIGNYDLSGCALYTSCYPCPMCMGACLWARLDAIYYSATAEEATTAGFDDKPFHDFLKNPCSDDKRKLEHVPTADYMRPFELWQKKTGNAHCY